MEHFPAIGSSDERNIQEVESLCMQCEEQGTTRLLLTSIPFFRQVILISFKCPHCGFANNEIQSAGQIQGMSFFLIILNHKNELMYLTKTMERSTLFEFYRHPI